MASSLPSTLLLLSLLFLSTSLSHAQLQRRQIQRRHLSAGLSNRRMLLSAAAMTGGDEEDEVTVTKVKTPSKKKLISAPVTAGDEEDGVTVAKVKSPSKKKPIAESSDQTKPIKLKKTISADTTTTIKPTKIKLNKAINGTKLSISTTKLPKPIKSNSTKLAKTQLKNIIATTTITSKPPKSPKKTSTDALPLPKKKTTTTDPPPEIKKKTTPSNSKTQQPLKPPKMKPKSEPSLSWLDQDDNDTIVSGGDDLMSEFRDLPSRLLLPDLEKISTTSRVYLSRANREIVKGVRPFVGNKYAPTIASAASAAFLLLPLLLLSLLFHHFKTYLSLQRVLIFIQAYLAIYFATLSLTAVTTGLEPLRFFYAASPAAYAWTQAVQTLGYVLYLLAQLMHLVATFSPEGGSAGVRGLALAQMVVGLAVGVHYYVVVFHRAVAGEPPRANWRVHGVYAACFVGVCALARAERRKKAYVGGAAGDDDGKKS